jgi:hypothetical protein
VETPSPTAARRSWPTDRLAPANLVLLHALGPNGDLVATLSTTVTGADGSFTLSSDLDAASTWLGIETVVGERHFMALLAAANGQTVGPVSLGVFQLVLQVAGSPAGRYLDDFSRVEIQTLAADAAAALTAAGTDLDDPLAVLDQLLDDLGGAVADYSGGSFSVEAISGIVTVDPPDLLTTIDSFYVELYDGWSEFWDIESSGAISDGTNDSYDSMFELSIDGSYFPSLTAGGADTQMEDGREAVLGPVADLGVVGLEVTRKIYVPELLSFARFAEILHNTTGGDITVDVLIDGNLGSDESTDGVHFSSSGDTEVTAEDEWIAMHWDSSDPAVGFFFPGAEPYKSSDDVEYLWPDVTIPAGGTIVIYHWGFQKTGGPVGDLAAIMGDLALAMPLAYFEGLSIAEGANGYNAGSRPNVVGEAGAVAPFAEVTATNLTAGGTASCIAAGDGSFVLFLRDTSSGDQVQVIATDGTDETVTIP